ncbi:DUF3331 domain-containing protein [bacterium M00.F.Ca.ET.228.01.1.1]|uniref:DUF3331 domain-containing protein n=1 Tax=Paraburkholderia phenoliruptrix TaxID=252970 RepID=UPI001092C090|nr:DUF3331 domain-containing protein [Paraburkholderia phenoliruptrix]TGP46091.1 DUF3331 domain-containing protein [bacterium M00.F.Ca.ET.228.01.1.1]TGS03997.1 DUF3331 domain-containing protein [bacterium M00.F.Ca.ET.191.01.1.1]TGU07384.1 DUF3331 domain-containing protein [bacterium M00.F.Ca.ET.155.01.1.1]MBW0446632.1 DUF3331 domain-containing protein [Paraburkholderia phenoliruptrix]MBW9096941.1 DUF3331 domain-containing protein [Paraburkholderia phenoliruptrix]
MLTKAGGNDPWQQTLGLLSTLSGGASRGVGEMAAPSQRASRSGARLTGFSHRSDVQIQVIDRPSRTTATVIWRDSTHCSYGDQTWHASRARNAGVCAMSGRAIQRGDAIYKPRPCRPAPLNAGAMILGSVMNEAAPA